VQIIDEFTGRIMADRAWEQGLHQLVEMKERCELTNRREPLAASATSDSSGATSAWPG